MDYKKYSIFELNDLLKNEKKHYNRRIIYGELLRKRHIEINESSFDTNSFIENYLENESNDSLDNIILQEQEYDNTYINYTLSDSDNESVYLPLIPPPPLLQLSRPIPPRRQRIENNQFEGLTISEPIERFAPILDNYEEMSQLEPVKLGLLSKDLVEKSIIRNSKTIELCVICQELIFLDIVRELHCNHCFHVDCIDTWFINKNNCPICKSVVGVSKFN